MIGASTVLSHDSARQQTHEIDAEHLRQEAQGTLVRVMVLLAWMALVDAVRTSQSSSWPLATAGLLVAGTALGGALSGRHPSWARWMLVCSLIGAYLTLILSYPGGASRWFGVLVLIACSSVIPDATYVALTISLSAALLLFERALPSIAADPLELFWTLSILISSTAFSLLSRNHFSTALSWASQSSHKALVLTGELRQRQLMLNRALRAMEEATYRIERINNELVLAQQETEAARAAKSRFAATVSHEIRGPLNLILGFSRSMALSPERYGIALSPAYHADADTIYRNAQHLADLVDDVLDLSRIEANHLPLVKDRVDLEDDVVRKVLENVRPLTERKGLYLREELVGDLPTILVDPVRLRQALLNLLINATRFTQRGGITVRTGRDEDSLFVSVKDTGPGISPEETANVFREFVQLSTDKEGATGGTGLGLSIAKSLVEAHGGRIWLESRPGVGTTVSFSLPYGHGPSLHSALVSTGEVHWPGKPLNNCLVVHDDPSVVNLLARYLEGYRITGLADENQVLRLTEELHPRAIVASSLIGESIREKLAATPYDVPLITWDMPRARQQHHLEHILGYLVKPIGPAALHALMGQVERDGETTVLIVDDEPDVVRLMENILTELPRPYRILRAYDGIEALDLMQATTPDIVFMDWFMPHMSGAQTIAHMRSTSRLSGIPVVIVSGRDWVEGQATIKTPISVECQKPLDIARAARCLEALLSELKPDYLPQLALPESLSPEFPE